MATQKTRTRPPRPPEVFSVQKVIRLSPTQSKWLTAYAKRMGQRGYAGAIRALIDAERER